MSGALQAHLVVQRDQGFSLDIPLTIEPGQTVALLGPNGAGKTTAVAALAVLTPLDDGRIHLGGKVLDEPATNVFVPPEERAVGVVFQDQVLFPHMTVAENVGFGLHHRRRAAVRQGVRDWIERLELGDLVDRRPVDLSGGESQRVALARALASEPSLLLLDEPLSALDATNRVQLRHTLTDHLAQFAGPRLLITHDATEAFLLSDEIHIIEDGRITQVGTADDIRLRPRTRFVADLAGANLLPGTASHGDVVIGGHTLHSADREPTGQVLATIHPRAIAVHRNHPEGSPRNTWQTTVTRVEHYGDRVRLQMGAPLPLTVEVTPEAVSALDLSEGSVVWISIKATEIGIEAQ